MLATRNEIFNFSWTLAAKLSVQMAGVYIGDDRLRTSLILPGKLVNIEDSHLGQGDQALFLLLIPFRPVARKLLILTCIRRRTTRQLLAQLTYRHFFQASTTFRNSSSRDALRKWRTNFVCSRRSDIVSRPAEYAPDIISDFIIRRYRIAHLLWGQKGVYCLLRPVLPTHETVACIRNGPATVAARRTWRTAATVISQGYAPFLWITLHLFYPAEQPHDRNR